MTQAYLAEQAGITQAMLCQIERGTKNPSLQVGQEIAHLLGCTVEPSTQRRTAGWQRLMPLRIVRPAHKVIQ